MSKSLKDLFSKQVKDEKAIDPRELTEVNPEEAEEIGGGAVAGPNLACDESCVASS